MIDPLTEYVRVGLLTRVRSLAPAVLLLSLVSCSFDTDRSAPHVQSAIAPGACGTTETLLPKLFLFLREDRFEPLRAVIKNNFDDPALRTLFAAGVRVVSQLGLDRTELLVQIAEKGKVEEKLAPLLTSMLEFMDGRHDNVSRYAAANAAAAFIDRCNPNHLLTAVEGIFRLESPSHGKPWLTALLFEAKPLLSDPTLQPFLDSFERNAESGRPAVIALVVQIMIFLADDNFAIDRVETLLESAVYPLVSEELRPKIEALVALLDEATRPEAQILEPIQGAVRCGLMHTEERDALIGFGYDLVASPELGLEAIVDTTNALVGDDGARSELALLADTVAIIRDDSKVSDDLRHLSSTMLSSPDVEAVVPVVIDLAQSRVLAEIFEAIGKLLAGCGRHAS
jgi:hypothetical protein